MAFAAILLFGAMEDVFNPTYIVEALASIPIGFLAVLGYVAMLHTMRGDITRNVALGLVGGIIANVVAAVLLTPLMRKGAGTFYLLYGPMLVASGHLMGYLFRRPHSGSEKQ